MQDDPKDYPAPPASQAMSREIEVAMKEWEDLTPEEREKVYRQGIRDWAAMTGSAPSFDGDLPGDWDSVAPRET